MTWQIFAVVVGLYVALPPLAYLLAKFGTAGYLRAIDRHRQQKQKGQ